MADINLDLYDTIQVDFPDKDYTYQEMESLREDPNLSVLWRINQSLGPIPIGDFETKATQPFGFDEVTLSIFGTANVSDVLDINLLESGGYAVAKAVNDDLIVVSIEYLLRDILDFDFKGYLWQYKPDQKVWLLEKQGNKWRYLPISSQWKAGSKLPSIFRYKRETGYWLYKKDEGKWYSLTADQLVWKLASTDTIWYIKENCDTPWTQLNIVNINKKKW